MSGYFKNKMKLGSVLGLLLFLCFIVAPLIPVASMLRPASKPFNCDMSNHIAYLENFGATSVHYLTNSYSQSPSTWTVRFTAHKSTGYEMTVTRDNEDACVAMSNVIDHISSIPMNHKQKR